MPTHGVKKSDTAYAPALTLPRKRWREGRGETLRTLVSGVVLVVSLLATSSTAHAGAQREENLSAFVRSQLSKAVADSAVREAAFANDPYVKAWLAEMSRRLERRIPDENFRLDLLNTIHYEATRAGLDPELVLGLIQIESGFRKYAVSPVGAQGLMQVMPFWTRAIGTQDHNLFHLRTNLRYGCTILRHYLDIERGDLFRALGRYNGSLGQPQYPDAVYAAWRKHWTYGITPVGLKGSQPASIRKGT